SSHHGYRQGRRHRRRPAVSAVLGPRCTEMALAVVSGLHDRGWSATLFACAGEGAARLPKPRCTEMGLCYRKWAQQHRDLDRYRREASRSLIKGRYVQGENVMATFDAPEIIEELWLKIPTMSSDERARALGGRP